MTTNILLILSIILQFCIFLLVLKLEVNMDVLHQAVARLQSSVSNAIAKINSLKAGQVDPAAIEAAATSLNALSDSLDQASAA